MIIKSEIRSFVRKSGRKCHLVGLEDDVQEALFTLDRVRVDASGLANLLCSSSVC